MSNNIFSQLLPSGNKSSTTTGTTAASTSPTDPKASHADTAKTAGGSGSDVVVVDQESFADALGKTAHKLKSGTYGADALGEDGKALGAKVHREQQRTGGSFADAAKEVVTGGAAKGSAKGDGAAADKMVGAKDGEKGKEGGTKGEGRKAGGGGGGGVVTRGQKAGDGDNEGVVDKYSDAVRGVDSAAPPSQQ